MRAADALQSPKRSILVAFAAWKLFLLAIALGSVFVADAYDTSASLALASSNTTGPGLARANGVLRAPTDARTLLTRLTSWDAIYFVAVARRGYVFEQEWAFGSGLPLVIGLVARGQLSSLFGDVGCIR